MKKYEFNAIEKEMANFDFGELQGHTEKATAKIAQAQTAGDIKAQICGVWSKIGKYVKYAEAIPVVGKFISVLADLLDTICSA